MKSLMSLIIAIGAATAAAGPDKVLLAKAGTWRAYSLMAEGRVTLRFESAKGASVFQPPIPGSQLLTATEAKWNGKSFLVTYWREGVSSTALRVFDPANLTKNKVFERYSVGDITYSLTPKGLSMTGAEPALDPLNPKPITEEWKAP